MSEKNQIEEYTFESIGATEQERAAHGTVEKILEARTPRNALLGRAANRAPAEAPAVTA